MSEFKSGDIVKCGDSNYVYACVNPIEKRLSLVIDPVTCEIESFLTDELILAPKTHTVNGFEVPSPISEEEYRDLKLKQDFYTFSAIYGVGYRYIKPCHIEIVAVKCGFVFRSESDIKKNIAALQGIDPSTVD